MENKIDWKNNLITAALSILVTVVAGVILFYVQDSKPSLKYYFEKIEPFETQKESKLTIFHITIENNGGKTIDDISSKIGITPATIKEYNIKPSSIFKIIDTLLNNELNISTKSLNPNESVKISLLASTLSEFPNEPLIQVRGNGVIGEKIDKSDEPDNKVLKFFSGDIWTYLIVSVFTLFSFFITKELRTNVTRRGKHIDNQERIIGYIFGVHGLIDEMERCLSLPKSTSYYSEFDRLTAHAIQKKDEEFSKKVRFVINDCIIYASMADTSMSIAYYNLAKIEKLLGNKEDSEKYINKAKVIQKSLIENRLTIDPFLK